MFLSDPVELLLPTTAHLLALLLLVVVLAFRAAPGSFLRRSRFAWVLLLLWAYLFSIPKLTDLLLVQLEGSPDQVAALPREHNESTLIVVLSSGELRRPGGKTRVRHDVMGWERIHGGVMLWRQTRGRMIFTGGPPGDAASSIAAASARIAQDLGVPASATELSSEAWNTEEELRFLQHRLIGHAGPVYLVTSAIHMPRALAIAQSLGLKLLPYPVGFRQIANHTWRTWVPANGTLERASAVMHELIGLWVYRIKRSP